MRMFNCRPYNMQMMTTDICVKNQEKIKEIKASRDGRQKWDGFAEIRFNAMPSDYFKIRKCDGCKVGQNRHKKALKVAVCAKE